MTITRITENSVDFDRCYALIQTTFPPEERVSREEYSTLLLQNSGNQSFEFALLAEYDDHAREQIIGIIAGSYLPLDRVPVTSIAMIEYLVVQPACRRTGGHGRKLLRAFEGLMQSIARSLGETLSFIFGEVDDHVVPFKLKCGYARLKGVHYAQPPIAFHSVTGEPGFPEVPVHLMVRSLQPVTAIDRAFLAHAVHTIYTRRYLPTCATPEARAAASAYIFDHVYTRFLESLGERPTIPLDTG